MIFFGQRDYAWAVAEKFRRIAMVRELLNDQSITDEEIWITWGEMARTEGPTSAFDVTRRLNLREDVRCGT